MCLELQMNNKLDLSVADLERLLDQRKTEWDGLARKKNKLERDLERVERQMAVLEGRRGARRGRKIGKRPKNEKSLRETVLDVLGRSKKGYSLAELSERILASGYKSNSSDFKNVVYQCLYNTEQIVHDPEMGTYRIK